MSSLLAELSPPGFGAASIGNLYRAIDDATAADTLAAAWDCGIRYFDTAPHYGLGLSERRLGAFLRQQPRRDFVVSTKVGRVLEPNTAYAGGRDLADGFDVPDLWRRRFDPTPDGIERSVVDSLERTGLDRFDILYLHDPDVYDLDRGLAEGLPALAGLREQGMVDAIGIGVNDAGVAARAIREGDPDLVMIAGRYTLLEQPAAAELLPLAADRGVGIVAAAPFNSGLLATGHPGADAHYNYGSVPPDLLDRARRLAQCCAEFGTDLPTAALHFPLRHPAVVTVVVGTARPEAIQQNCKRMNHTVPNEFWDECVRRGLLDPEVAHPEAREVAS